MSKHSLLPPSSAARRLACPGSRALEARFYNTEESDAAKEGDAAHWVLSEVLKSKKLDNSHILSYKNGIAPNGVKITKEIIDGVILASTHIKSHLQRSDLILHVEEPINISSIHPEMWGTPDACLYDNYDIYIWDFKYGYRFVEVFENWQLIAYAAGLLQGCDKEYNKYTFHLTIIQPRCYGINPIRKWTVSATQMQSYFEKLQKSTILSMQPNAPCTPSPECKYCSARHVCKALQVASLGVVEETFTNTAQVNTPDELSNELRLLNRAKRLLDARLTGIEAQAISEIKAGKSVPHFTIEQGQGREYWSINTDEALILGKLFNIDLAKPIELITPKQAADAGVPKEILSTITATPSGATKLVEVDENKLKNIFSK